jgi:hypothetical protein
VGAELLLPEAVHDDLGHEVWAARIDIGKACPDAAAAHVSLPLPDGWAPVPGRESYTGVEGLLDPRVGAGNDAVDVGQEIRRLGGDVRRLVVQGRPCLRGQYVNQGATVVTYSIDMGNGTEVRAVYVFRPGHETTMAEVESALLAEEPGRDRQSDERSD